MLGVTLLELMVAIAIMAIVLGLAVPNFSRWVTNGRIRVAASRLQEDMQWARAYAVKANAPVYMQLEYQQAASPSACSWVDTLTQPAAGVAVTTATQLMNGPSMTVARFASEYNQVACMMTATTEDGTVSAIAAPPPGTPYVLAFYPDGTIRAPGGAPLESGSFLFEAKSDTTNFAHWTVKYYGAGELRSCASSAATANGNWPCALQ